MEYTDFVTHTFLLIYIIPITVITLALGYLYKFIRPKLPVKVNCWFCNRNFSIPYTSKDCWQCPGCEQYNGFSKDGDYNPQVNKRISSLHCQIEKTPKNSEPQNGFCSTCNDKQALKVQQLAAFTPMVEDNYDEEIEHFRKQLENWYKLCRNCENILSQALKTQQYKLLTNRLNDHRKASPDMRSTFAQPKLRQTSLKILRQIWMFALSLLTVISSGKIIDEYLPVSVSDIVGSTLCGITSAFFKMGFGAVRELSALGMLSCFATAYGQTTRKNELILIMWGIIGALSWIDSGICLLAVCVATMIIQFCSVDVSKPYFKKKDIRKQVSEPTNVARVKPVTNLVDVVANSVKKKAEENKCETAVETPKVKVTSNKENVMRKVKKVVNKVEEVVNKVQTRSQTVKKQDDAVTENKRSRMYSPPPEVYEGLKGLHITPLSSQVKQPEVKDASNESRKWNVLRPSKLNPKENSSKDDGDSTRSLTPISVISSQSKTVSDSPKIHVSDHMTVSPLYPKTNSPLFNRCDFDPYLFTTGFAPSFPGLSPLGHTTVYTYTRPTGIPYGFPSQRFSPIFDHSAPFSPRISEISDSMNGSQLLPNYLSTESWTWIKIIIYSSFFFNILSLFILCISYFR